MAKSKCELVRTGKAKKKEIVHLALSKMEKSTMAATAIRTP